VKELSKDFNLVLVDLLGMGSYFSILTFRSARIDNKVKGHEEAENFFVDSLEMWRTKMNLNSFILAGHSFGGYIAAVYALKYPTCVEHLLLLSPVGVPEKPEDFNKQNIIDRIGTKKGKIGVKTAFYLWEKNYSPFGVLRAGGSLITNKVLNNYINKGMPNISKEERKALRNYLKQIFLRRGTSEYHVNHLLQVVIFTIPFL